MKNFGPLDWKENYSVDITSIDKEHQELLKLLNAFTDAVISKAPKEQLLERFQAIVAHTLEHFAHEEQIMRNIGYPDLEAHQKQHEGLVSSAQAVANELQNGDSEEMLTSVVDFLTALVLRHMVHSDREIYNFMSRVELDSDEERQPQLVRSMP